MKIYFKGQLAINIIWVSKEIKVTSTAYLSYGPEPGDHHPVIASVSKRSLIGEHDPRVKKVMAYKLNYKISRIQQEYIDRLEALMKSHNILDRRRRLETEAEKEFGTKAKRALENWTGKSRNL